MTLEIFTFYVRRCDLFEKNNTCIIIKAKIYYNIFLSSAQASN